MTASSRVAEQRGRPVAVGFGQGRALDRVAAQLGQRRRVALQLLDDRPKARRSRHLPVQQSHQLGFAVQTARAAVRLISLDQLLEAGVRNMLQNFRQHGMVVGHGVAPLSGPDRRKRPECEQNRRRAPE